METKSSKVPVRKKQQDVFIPGYLSLSHHRREPVRLESKKMRPDSKKVKTPAAVVANKKVRRLRHEDEISTDVSEITSEVERLSRLQDHPEVAIKDANRLLREIDEHMEISFEIMEERQSMVRSYLLEREKAEQKHKSRADRIMEEFTSKMGQLEEKSIDLQSAAEGSDKRKCAFSQTDIVEVVENENQTSIEVVDRTCMDEAVQAVTEQLRDAYSSELCHERERIFRQVQRQFQMLTLRNFDTLLLGIPDDEIRAIAKRMTSDLLKDSEVDGSNENRTLQYLIDGEVSHVQFADAKLTEKLKIMREEFVNERKALVHNYTDKKHNENMKELRRKCTEVDDCEVAYNEKLTALKESLKDETLYCQIVQQIESEDQLNIDTSLNEKNPIADIKDAQESLRLKENELSNFLLVNFVKVDNTAVQSMLELLKLSLRSNLSFDMESGIERSINMTWLDSSSKVFRSTTLANNEIEAIRSIHDKIGPNLVKDLMKPEDKALFEASDIAHYQDIPIEEIVTSYENELSHLNAHLNDANAMDDLRTIISQPLCSNTVQTLIETHEGVKRELSEVSKLHDSKNDELNCLKKEKDRVIELRRSYVSERNEMKRKLNVLNKHISDKLLTEERVTGILATKGEICRIQTQIDILNGKYKSTVGDKSKVLEQNGIDIKNLLSKKLISLKDDLDKLAPFVDSGERLGGTGGKTCMPTSEEVDRVVKQRVRLSEKLVQTESKIQDILTQSSSDNGSLEHVEELQFDSPRVTNVHMSNRLIILEAELDRVNQDIQSHDFPECDVANLRKVAGQVADRLEAIQRELQEHPSDKTKQLGVVKRDVTSVKRKLRECGVQDFEPDQEKIDNLKQSRNNFQEKVKAIKDKIAPESKNGDVIRDAMRELLQERDRTKNVLLTLDKDLENLASVTNNFQQEDTCEKKLIQVESSIIKKKEDCVTRMIIMASEHHREYIESVKHDLQTKIAEKVSEGSDRKKLSKDEKAKLREELKSIVVDMKQTENELKELHSKPGEHQLDSTLMMTLTEKKKDLTEALKEVERSLQREQTKPELARQLVSKKDDIRTQLADLEERLNSQENVLKVRYKKLIGIKEDLETKISESVDVEELGEILKMIESKKTKKSTINEEEVAALIKEKKTIQNGIMQLLQEEPLEKEKINEFSKAYDNIDTLICTRLDEMMINLSEDEDIYLRPDTIMDVISNLWELTKTLEITSPRKLPTEKVSDESLKENAEEIRQLQELKHILEDFQQRKIEINDVEDLTQLKSLNNEKLDRLVVRIKNLNVLMDKQKQQSEDAESAKATADRLSRKLGALVTSCKDHNESHASCESPKPEIKTGSICSLLSRRDELLNALFTFEKELGDEEITIEAKRVLLSKKDQTEREIDEIDEKILDGDFAITKEEIQSSRSFSPRSTSSRNSITDVLNERDHVMRNIFQLEKEEQKLKNTTLTNIEEELQEVHKEKTSLQTNLKELDALVMDEKHTTTNDTIVEEKDYSIKDIREEIKILNKELNDGKITINDSDDITLDVNNIRFTPAEIEIINSIKHINDQLSIEKMKLKLANFQKQKKEIEESIRDSKSPEMQNPLKEEESTTRTMLSTVENKIKLINMKEGLQKELSTLKEQIAKNEMVFEKTEALTHLEFLKMEQEVTFQEYKKNKESLEHQIDDINSLINQYSCVIEDEIKLIEDCKTNNLKDALVEPYVKEGKEALTQHKEELENLVSEMNNKKECKTPLKDLLAERKNISERFGEMESKMPTEDEGHLKTLTENIKSCYKSHRQLLNKRKRLEKKISLIDEKLREPKQESTPSPQKTNVDKFKTVLGEELFNFIRNDKVCVSSPLFDEIKSFLENDTLKAFLDSRRRRIQELESKLHLAQEKMSSKNDEIDILKDNQAGDVKLLHNNLSVTSKRNEELAKQLQEYKESNSFLEDDNKALREKFEKEKEKSNSRKEEYCSKINHLTSMNVELEESVSGINNEILELKNLIEKMKQNEEKVKDEAKLSDEREEAALAELEEVKKESEKQVEDLKKQLIEAEDSSSRYLESLNEKSEEIQILVQKNIQMARGQSKETVEKLESEELMTEASETTQEALPFFDASDDITEKADENAGLLKEKIVELGDEIRELTNQNKLQTERYEKELSNSQTNITKLEGEIRQLNLKIESLQADCEDLLTANDDLKSEKKQLREELEVKKVSKDLFTIKEEKSLEDLLDEKPEDRVDALEESIVDDYLLNELNISDHKLEKAEIESHEKSFIINSLQAKNEDLERELVDFKEQLKDLDHLREQLLKYKVDIEEKKTWAELLNEENSDIKKQLDDLETRIVANNKVNEDFKRQISEQLTLSAKLADENLVFREKLDMLAKTIVESEAEETRKLLEHSKTRDQLMKTNEELTRQLASVTNLLSAKEDRREEKQQEMISQYHSVNQQEVDSMREKLELNTQLLMTEQLKVHEKLERNAVLTEKLAEREQQITELQVQVKVFDEKLSDKEKLIISRETIVKDRENKLEESQTKVENLRSKISELADQLNSLTDAKKASDEEIICLKASTKDLGNLNDKQTSSIDKLEGELISIGERNMNLVQEKDELGEYLNQLESEHTATSLMLESTAETILLLKEKIGLKLYNVLTCVSDGLTENVMESRIRECLERTSVENLLHELLEEMRRMDEKQTNELETKPNITVEKLQQLSEEYASAKETLAIVNSEKRALERQLADVKEQLETVLKRENDIYVKQLEELENQLKLMSKQNEESEEDVKKDGDTINRLTHENKMLTQKAEHLYEQIEYLRKKEIDLYSETESLRDTLQLSARRGNELSFECCRVKEEFVDARKKLQDSDTECKKLRDLIKAGENAEESNKAVVRKLNLEVKRLGLELAENSMDVENLTQDKAQLKSNNENLCLKLQKIHKEKNELQSRIDKQAKHLTTFQEKLDGCLSKENNLKLEIRDKCDIVEAQQKTIGKLNKSIAEVDKQMEALRCELFDVKQECQNLTLERKEINDLHKQELRDAKLNVDEMKSEIEMLSRLKNEGDVNAKKLKNECADAKKSHLQRESELLMKLEEQDADNRLLRDSIDDYLIKLKKCEQRITDMRGENRMLIDKNERLDEEYEKELTNLRASLNGKFNSDVDKMNDRLRKLTSDMIEMDKLNESLTSSNKNVTRENREFSKRLDLFKVENAESERLLKVKIASLKSEMEGLKFENNDLKEQINDMKVREKKAGILEIYEQELNERKAALDLTASQLEEEKTQFNESIEKHVQKINVEKKLKGEQEQKKQDKVSLAMLKNAQEQQETLSAENATLTREFHNLKVEMRKMKALLREKENCHVQEEKRVVRRMEDKVKQRTEEVSKSHAVEKEALVKLQNEERANWENEMNSLTVSLQEENQRKLCEQREDFERELQTQVYKYLKEKADEISELLAKNEQLQREKVEIVKQFEQERCDLTKEHDSETASLEQTVRRLLNHLIQLKEKQSKLRFNHQFEITEFEERMEQTKERLQQKHSQEVDMLKDTLHKSLATSINKEKQFLHSTLEQIVREVSVVPSVKTLSVVRMPAERDRPAEITTKDLLRVLRKKPRLDSMGSVSDNESASSTDYISDD